MSNTFTCEQCGGTFTKGRSDEEAAAEAFGDDLGDNPAVVCDDCFKMMTSEYPPIEYRADLHSSSPSEFFAECHRLVEEQLAKMNPLERMIHDEMVRRTTDLMLYGYVRESARD